MNKYTVESRANKNRKIVKNAINSQSVSVFICVEMVVFRSIRYVIYLSVSRDVTSVMLETRKRQQIDV